MTTGQATWTAMVNALKAGWTAGVNLNRVALYSYPGGGPSAAAVAIHDIAPVAGAVVGSLPNQVSRVVTLITGQAGRSHRGRIYVPAQGETMSGNTGHYARDASTLLSALKDWIIGNKSSTYLSDGVSGGLLSVVSTSKKNDPEYAGAKTPVVTLRTDNIPDIQRRRANRSTGLVYQNQAL